MKKLGKLGLKMVKDPYGSGMTPPARPKSNWHDVPAKSPLKANYVKECATPNKTKHEMPRQPHDASKGFMPNMSKPPGYGVVKKSDKWKA